jgi:glycosyltransferase involved in cell wall biosynthesis
LTRVLLVCPEPLSHGQPAGVGVRFLEMANVLRGDRHDVTMISPDGGGLEAESIRRKTAEADVAVVQGHAANALFAHGQRIPAVVDLYDPFIIENLHYYATRGAEVFQHDHATLMQSLMRGDVFLCASEAQRMFYLGLLLAVGRLNPATFEDDPHLDALVRIAPFGVQPPRPAIERRGNSMLFGGIYDWYDPILAIDAAAIARRSLPDLTVTFTRHPNPDLTPQGKTAEAIAYASRRGYESFVRFEPWVPYNDRGPFFERFRIALITFPQSIETDLSMRTRVYDYLWGGLPIVTSSAPGTDEILERYGAGSVIDAETADAFAAAIVAILENDARYRKMIEGARRFVAEHQWPQVLQPLRDFCRQPRIDGAKETFASPQALAARPASMLDRLKRRIGGGL